MEMIFLSKPADQGRLNATIHELTRMRFDGPVFVSGRWDPLSALGYLERRQCIEIIPTMRSDGSLFQFNNKYVLFTDAHVVVCSRLDDAAID
jgi:hypothetical protein